MMSGMSTVNVVHTESTVSSVRSNVSTASSGYVIISSQTKQRTGIRDVYIPEPPPDYDDSPLQSEPQSPLKTRPQENPGSGYESRIPLLVSHSEPKSPLKSQPQENPGSGYESRVPLLSNGNLIQRDETRQKETIIRINSQSHDLLNIEIVSNCYSPNSETSQRPFIYDETKNIKKRKCRKLSKREKILLAVLIIAIIVVIVLVIIVINFTVCIGEFTSACK